MEQGIVCFVQTSMISCISLLPVLASHIGVSVRPASQWLEKLQSRFIYISCLEIGSIGFISLEKIRIMPG